VPDRYTSRIDPEISWSDVGPEDICHGDGQFQTEAHVYGVGVVCRRCCVGGAA
jgi:hypothetical protein